MAVLDLSADTQQTDTHRHQLWQNQGWEPRLPDLQMWVSALHPL